ncbi:6418_t:CDS:2, partial [Gigaspora rosea]
SHQSSHSPEGLLKEILANKVARFHNVVDFAKEKLQALYIGGANPAWEFRSSAARFITRAFKKQKWPENDIAKLNRKLIALKTQQAGAERESHPQTQIGELEYKVNSEVSRLAEKWSINLKPNEQNFFM